MELGLLCGGHDVVHADLPCVVTVADVVGDAAVEQDGLLGDDANLGAQEGHAHPGGLMSVDQLHQRHSQRGCN